MVLGKNFWSKNFLPATPNIRSLKDKSAAKVFTIAFKSNPGIAQNLV